MGLPFMRCQTGLKASFQPAVGRFAFHIHFWLKVRAIDWSFELLQLLCGLDAQVQSDESHRRK